jgi:hypothetical protein
MVLGCTHLRLVIVPECERVAGHHDRLPQRSLTSHPKVYSAILSLTHRIIRISNQVLHLLYNASLQAH